ncbi:TBC1 domain family member 5 [Loa loa]|uniref:TBC1 domain family member 5 n=1 Tax=Loa loa TaxID=7209 RepID=A0A1S0UG61_LOALO|nr:TBC1 domain family member 5 [Loa loa]EJD74406.1 TBC1 domain family member 5 [Loa loa]
MHNSSHQPIFQKEWKEFFGQRVNLQRIEKGCLGGKLRGSHVRSIIWRILLRCLPLEREEWCTILSRTRNSYNKLKSELLTNPREQTSVLDPNVSNPLSLGDENPWQQYFIDCKLRECINRDVERTFPELEYFKDENIRTVMSDILFIYAKHHPDIAYKQGMHEILATLIFVLNYDQQTFAHLMEQNELKELPPEELKILCAVNNQDFLEHDSFEIFTQLMMMLERWYLASDEEYTEYSNRTLASNNKLGHSVPFVNPDDASDSRNELIIKLRSIMNDILAVIDPAMHQHLSKLNILPQIYGIRWLRLLFSREFPIHDLLFVWDAIFAFRPSLSLVDYIFVAMLEYIRHLIINEDYSTTLQYLMRYPPVADAHSLIQYALHIKSPKKFEVPQTLSVTNFENITVAGVVHPNRTKDIVETKIAMEKSKASPPKQFPSSGMIFYNGGENRHQHGDNKSFVAKIVDTLSDRTMIERGLIRPQVNYSKGGHFGMKASNEMIELLQEQVSCLQSRLNDMDMMAGIVKQRIGLVIDEQLPKIIGNDGLKNLIAEELRGIRSQVENAVRLGTKHAKMTVSSGFIRDTREIVRDTGSGAIEVGNEVHVPTVRSLHNSAGSSSMLRLQVSQLDTEMREIRPHSAVQ